MRSKHPAFVYTHDALHSRGEHQEAISSVNASIVDPDLSAHVPTVQT